MFRLSLLCSLIVLSSASAHADDAGLKLANENACMTCHAIDHKVIGPPFHSVAERYRNDPQASALLLAKLEHGGAGSWGNTPMPPNPQANPQDLQKLVQWVLAQ